MSSVTVLLIVAAPYPEIVGSSLNPKGIFVFCSGTVVVGENVYLFTHQESKLIL